MRGHFHFSGWRRAGETFADLRARGRCLHHELHARSRELRADNKNLARAGNAPVDAGFFKVSPGNKPRKRPGVILSQCRLAFARGKMQNASHPCALDPLAARQKFRLVFLGGASGDDSYAREFFELLRTRENGGEHAGFVDREKLKTWLRASTLLALPSLEDNCPMTVLEAMASGVPVVAANVGGVPDLIEDAKTGLLCDPLDAGSMRNAVEKLLGQPSLAQTLAKEANRRAHGRFHPAVIARRHLEIYREVLNTRS